MKESPNLDILRSCAVSFVVLSHLRYFFGWNAEGIYSLETLGRLGVAIFFVHTTLVLMMSLERHGARAGPFLIRRFFRIYPLAMTVVTLTALIEWRWGSAPVDVGEVVSNLLLIQNVTGHASTPLPLWSLPYEVQMYLFLPALYTVSKASKPTRRMGLICAGSLALALCAWATSMDFHLFRYIPCFLPGALAFVLWQRRNERLSPFVLFAVVGFAVLTIPALVAAGAPETPLFWCLCLSLGLTIPMCRQITYRPVMRCAKVIATYSYGIYLTHILALGIAFGSSTRSPGAIQWAVCFVMLAALSYLAYHGVEKHGISLGIRLAKSFSQPGDSGNLLTVEAKRGWRSVGVTAFTSRPPAAPGSTKSSAGLR